MLDKLAAQAILALKYDYATDMHRVLLDTGDMDLFELILASGCADGRVNETLSLVGVRKNQEAFNLTLDYLVDKSNFKHDVSCAKWYASFLEVFWEFDGYVKDIDKHLLVYASSRGYRALVELLYDRVVHVKADDLVIKYAYAYGHQDIIDWVLRKQYELRANEAYYDY